ncbi:MAG: sulfatase-like hydrolase/transferase, partial [Akkermansiaceae bacterium]|nr:sulfatase-like hydrolase/transferase [Akkermansiaceae bacterium]
MKPILSILFAASCGLPAAQMPNVLFIAVDDLKPMLGCYGDTVIKTPNIDRLASRGTTFLNAYCQQAICGPTRASLLTGLRPDSTGIYDLQTKLRALHPDVITLPQYFKQSGYESVGIGKIFDPRNVEGEVRDDPKSWSRPYTKQIENADSRLGFLKPDFVKRVDVVVNEKGLEQSDLEAITKAVGGMPTE